jgi:hypothetical protein
MHCGRAAIIVKSWPSNACSLSPRRIGECALAHPTARRSQASAFASRSVVIRNELSSTPTSVFGTIRPFCTFCPSHRRRSARRARTGAGDRPRSSISHPRTGATKRRRRRTSLPSRRRFVEPWLCHSRGAGGLGQPDEMLVADDRNIDGALEGRPLGVACLLRGIALGVIALEELSPH